MISKKAIRFWLLGILLFNVTNTFALDAIASKKATFLLDVARKVTFNFESQQTYKIGIYGTGREFKDLAHVFEAIANSGTEIHGTL